MKHYRIDSVDAYNKLYGLTTYHPLVAAVDLKEAKYPVPAGTYEYRDCLLYTSSVKVSGDKLKIGRKDSFKSSNKSLSDVTVTVHAPAVTDFEATTASVITVTAPLKATGSEVEIEVSTAGSVTVPGITCSDIEIDASTAGTVNISGNTSAGFISTEASTGSSVKVGGISGDKVKAESSTGASITLSGNADKADLSASTGGSVQASGLKAKSISRSSSSGGSIH